MDRGTYIAASGGLVQLRQLEIVNNNLANSNTPGFKGQFLISRTRQFDETLADELSTGDPYAAADHMRTPDVASVSTVTDFTPGAVKGTGNPLDLALRNPNDFFVVNTSAGPQYTRAGNFSTNTAGQLVTNDGNIVQGTGGAIEIPAGKVDISANGTISVNKEAIGKLQVVRFADPRNLQRVGSNRFALGQGTAAPTPLDDAELIPQSLEMSNVSAIESMIGLIAANRAFEMYTKSAKTLDEMNQTSIQQVGKSR